MGTQSLQYITVNRHTGGLENRKSCQAVCKTVNRHTGGLEMTKPFGHPVQFVNRHTGGLEKDALEREQEARR